MSEIPVSSTALCPAFNHAMSVLGKRWNGAIIHILGNSSCRFTDIRTAMSTSGQCITDTVLTRRLDELLGCGIIKRVPQPDTTRQHYALTEKGRALLPALDNLTEWARTWAIEN